MVKKKNTPSKWKGESTESINDETNEKNETTTTSEDDLVSQLEKVALAEEEEENIQEDSSSDDDGSPTLKTIARWIKEGAASKIFVLSGAGVSCAAGIPDFRTPGTGL